MTLNADNDLESTEARRYGNDADNKLQPGTPLAKRYYENGYIFPVDVLNRNEAAHYRAELESLETRLTGTKVGNKSQLSYPQVIFKFAPPELVRHPTILGCR